MSYCLVTASLLSFKTCNQSHSGDQAGLDCSFLSRCWPKRCFLKRCCLQGFARNLAIEADWETIWHWIIPWMAFIKDSTSFSPLNAREITTNMSHFLSHTYLTKRMWECPTLPFYRKTQTWMLFQMVQLVQTTTSRDSFKLSSGSPICLLYRHSMNFCSVNRDSCGWFCMFCWNG